MRIAVICSLFPPNILGGAEVSASQLATNLAMRGHNVSVLTSDVGGEAKGDPIDGLSVSTVKFPRAYNLFETKSQSNFQKSIWHMQDVLDPRNRQIWGEFLDRVKPDFALIHVVQGLGYNGLLEVGKRDIPAIAILHDLGYACYKTSMFKNGHSCESHCLPCKFSSQIKSHYLKSVPRLGLTSPSLANLKRIQSLLPVADRPSRVILNPNTYPDPDRAPNRSKKTRFLFVGQVVKAKGVDFLLNVADGISSDRDLEVVVVGGGVDLDDLQARFGNRPWVKFTGKVSLQEVANHMGDADVLCVPSIWADNSPGVIVHAAQLGLPVLGSAIGGIGELIADGTTGLLLQPGQAGEWRDAMIRVMDNPEEVVGWRANSLARSENWSPKKSVDAYEEFIGEIIASKAADF